MIRGPVSPILLFAGLVAELGCVPATYAPREPKEVVENPRDAAKEAATDPARFGWDLFLYLNAPADSKSAGVRDPAKRLGDAGKVVWQTWKSTSEVYVNPGQKPLPWGENVVGDPLLSHNQIDGQKLLDHNGNLVMYEVRLNHDTFDYLVSRNLYSLAGQEEARSQAPVSFPWSSIEVKASWRILDPVRDRALMDRYFTENATYVGADCSRLNLTVGLTGLHITSKALEPNWFWVTFEHVDNAATTQTKLQLPISPEVARINTQMEKELAQTVWRYYQMDGYQTQFTSGGSATLLANSQIETNFQKSSSCITCHSLASIGSTANLAGVRFPFFQNGSQAYVGDPPTSDFGPGPDQYTKLDFVWSMQEAKRQPASECERRQ